MAGKLYIVGTPIGNLKDISERVKSTLKNVDLIFVEDTRVSIKLLSHLGISKTLISCHDFNEEGRSRELKKFADADQSVALISDAGMPLISDPGHKIVQAALDLNMSIEVIPGPSSILQAIIGSGLACERFSFEGFLPEKAGERRRRLEKIKHDDRTLVFFLPLSDLEKVIPEFTEIFGNRKACLCRELTKMHEEYIRADLSYILEISRKRPLKGEAVLVIAGSSLESQRLDEASLKLKLEVLLTGGARLKEAANMLAKDSGWASSEVYKLGLELKERHRSNAKHDCEKEDS